MGNSDEEASTKKEFANGKGKEKDEAEVTVAKDKGMILSQEKKEKKAVANRASMCSRLVFFVLLASLALTISLFRLDYKKGQLQELKAQLPPEIHDVLEKAENVSRDLIAKVTELYIQVLVTVEELSSHVPVGDNTLADILFSKKKPKMATAEQKAEEKAKKDVELALKKLKEEELEEKKKIDKEKKRLAAEEESKKLFADAEQKRQEQFLQSRLAAEAENKRLAAEEEKRQLAESEARKKSELEAFKKAEAEAARLEMEFAEERRKKEELEAIKKAEEELAEKLRAEKLNAEIEEKHRLAQEEANIKFQEVKKRLKETGAEFVSNEEFDKIKDKEIGKGASAAA